MRLLPAALIAVTVALAGCARAPEEPEIPPFTLDGNGLQPTLSGLRIDFGRAQPGVIASVSRLVGSEPSSVTRTTECGAGPMTIATWPGGLALNFVEGDFRGWSSFDPDIPVAGGFTPGLPRVDMPQTSFQVTSLGNEFNTGPISGILDPSETAIQQVWSGVTCAFR